VNVFNKEFNYMNNNCYNKLTFIKKSWCSSFKGIGSILFLKNGLEKKCRKSYKSHLRNDNDEVCTSVARCIPNILDVLVLENINLSSDRIRRPPLWSNEKDFDFCHQMLIYAVSSVYFNMLITYFPSYQCDITHVINFCYHIVYSYATAFQRIRYGVVNM
jgi:hypothetical protein